MVSPTTPALAGRHGGDGGGHLKSRRDDPPRASEQLGINECIGLNPRPTPRLDLTRFRGHSLAWPVGSSERRPSATFTTPVPARVPS
jgi:hypothetical protein